MCFNFQYFFFQSTWNGMRKNLSIPSHDIPTPIWAQKWAKTWFFGQKWTWLANFGSPQLPNRVWQAKDKPNPRTPMKRATKNTLSKGHIFSSLTPQIWEKMEKFQIFNFKLTLTWQIFDGLQKIITHKSCSFGRQTTFV